MSSTSDNQWATYIRKSTEEQDDQHQRQDIKDWFDYKDIPVADVDFYSEAGSGASSNRDEFNDLLNAIENGEYSDVVVWEVSRIARKGELAQRFFDSCEDAGVTIHVTNGSVRKIEADGTGRLVADIIASVAAEERRQLIRRTESGQRRAREQGKWLGQTPVGFVRSDEGYLKPNLNPDYDSGETGFFDVADALERVESGESYNKTAENTPNLTRQTLSKIHQDDDRRGWYIEGEAEDDRVQDALTEVDV
ncbi:MULTISPECIES: recombinase family protein [Halorussus]|uniref:Recombinase family protein n=2 Tax=Halorussus TaxID=1070314 RepID=A0A8U0HUJ7_9EURY|nr:MULTISPECIES: recombinase family protein [Halorussus]UPV74587.1 recombinase family protein [Halorussus limi]